MSDFEVRAKYGTSSLMNALEPADAAAATKPILTEEAMRIARRFSEQAISPSMVSSLLRVADFILVPLIGLIALKVYVEPHLAVDWRYILPLCAAPFFTTAFIQTVEGYNPSLFHAPIGQAGRLITAWTLVFAGFAVAVFFLKQGDFFSRLWFGAWYAGGLAYFLVVRTALAFAVRAWNRDGRFQRRAVIVGGGPSAAELIRSLEASPSANIQICGLFDDRSGDRSPGVVQGYPRLGTFAELVEFGRIAKIDMLIVSLPVTAESRLLQILKKLWVLPVDIRLSAHTDKLRFRPRSYSYIGTVPLLDVIERPIADWDSLVKRAFDIVFATAGLILLAPIFIATAIAVRVDSKGPVLFRQKRYGFNNEVIEVFKFRSMYVEASDHDAKVAVTQGDPRVTPVGRIIRKTSLDELPQLVNVLMGSLSLVGPRPHAVGSNTKNAPWELVVDGYFARHKVKPGVTGWAQINGWRGEVDTPEKLQGRIAHDLYYIENWSPLFDLTILLRTPLALVNTKNAY